jgi:hypothetical protein
LEDTVILMVQKSTTMIMGMKSIQRRKDIAMELIPTFMRRSVTQKRVTEILEMCSRKR